MTVVIICRGLAGFSYEGLELDNPLGSYLQVYDIDYAQGRGRVLWTPDRTKALLFEDMPAAVACYQQISPLRPLRGDGRPNRPISAYTVEISELT